jgi:hypothetical protein
VIGSAILYVLDGNDSTGEAMRIALDYDDKTLLRCWGAASGEIAYAKVGLRGPRLDIEFPSDWHEHRRAWVRIGLGLVTFAFSFPWSRIVPDHGQCSGPTYGFYFFGDSLVLEYGKTRGTRGDPIKHIRMPWGWKFQREWKEGGEPREYSYRYERESGEIQERMAKVGIEVRVWTRRWIPWRMERRTISVEFNDEVGERTGSWKGGTMGCSYEMLPGETRLECLRRMERERRFH